MTTDTITKSLEYAREIIEKLGNKSSNEKIDKEYRNEDLEIIRYTNNDLYVYLEDKEVLSFKSYSKIVEYNHGIWPSILEEIHKGISEKKQHTLIKR